MFGFHPDKLVKEGKFEKLEGEVAKLDAEKCKQVAEALCFLQRGRGRTTSWVSIPR